ncbi:tetratricopeptide repeat protein [Qipengyuania nanhaisediminis]|uniref:TPR repeat n=1 Tax=Qipengyuania nanhaisediminis TaxID=604088 RepID=A0A1I5PCA7_9SPHN|nr:tetratricopeptide repeat protein [Qipengyuania nanhaisediminis]SFP31151.1 TPR repeat [Qipengyuania nanhaisediminis]
MTRNFLAILLAFGALAFGPPAQAGNAPDTERSKIERSCFDGNQNACLSAGRIFARLSGEERAIKAREMFAQGCDLGNAQACHLLVPMLLEGRGGPQELVIAAQISGILCEAGSGQGCSWQANVLARVATLGGKIDPAKLTVARKLYLQACDMGAMDACGQAGALLATGTGGPSDPKSGYTLLERACAAEQWQACANIGVMARDGLAHDADEASARRYLKMACDGKIATACNDLGIMWMQLADRGEGESWREPALGAFTAACDGLDGAGCSNAARQLREGRGVPQNLEGAYDLALKGCNHKSGGACFIAADMRMAGEGVALDRRIAANLARKACDLGYAPGCGTLSGLSASD